MVHGGTEYVTIEAAGVSGLRNGWGWSVWSDGGVRLPVKLGRVASGAPIKPLVRNTPGITCNASGVIAYIAIVNPVRNNTMAQTTQPLVVAPPLIFRRVWRRVPGNTTVAFPHAQ